jgi:hypothetical protein
MANVLAQSLHAQAASRTIAVHALQGGVPTMSPSAIVRQATIWPAALFVIMFWAFVTPAHATTIFTATMSGSQEVPPTPSTATGFATAILSDDQLTLAVTESFSGLVGGGASAAHIHCCASAGATAGVTINFAGAGFPFRATSGSFSHTFTLATDVTGITPAVSRWAALESGIRQYSRRPVQHWRDPRTAVESPRAGQPTPSRFGGGRPGSGSVEARPNSSLSASERGS